MADKQMCISIYPTPDLADEAFARLASEGFGMNLLSVVGRDYWAHMAGSRHSWGWHGEGGFRYGGTLGAFWDKLWAKLPGGGVFCFFKDGPMLVAGLLSRAIMAKQDGRDGETPGDVNRNGFEAALSGVGILAKDVAVYQKALMDNQILLFVFGSAPEVDRAQFILNETKAVNHTIHHSSADFDDPVFPLAIDDASHVKVKAA